MPRETHGWELGPPASASGQRAGRACQAPGAGAVRPQAPEPGQRGQRKEPRRTRLGRLLPLSFHSSPFLRWRKQLRSPTTRTLRVSSLMDDRVGSCSFLETLNLAGRKVPGEGDEEAGTAELAAPAPGLSRPDVTILTSFSRPLSS